MALDLNKSEYAIAMKSLALFLQGYGLAGEQVPMLDTKTITYINPLTTLIDVDSTTPLVLAKWHVELEQPNPSVVPIAMGFVYLLMSGHAVKVSGTHHVQLELQRSEDDSSYSSYNSEGTIDGENEEYISFFELIPSDAQAFESGVKDVYYQLVAYVSNAGESFNLDHIEFQAMLFNMQFCTLTQLV